MVDGHDQSQVNFHSLTQQPLSDVFSRNMPAGFHCLVLLVKKSRCAAGCLQVTP
jgi:hypothetical protein